MFPVKGTTVWVNFRDKSYLGKVLQTSPELDMVCVRISNYLDHVSRETTDTSEFIAHSCPESNPSLLSHRQSSVVVTCGLDDICLIESNKPPHFDKLRFNSNSEDFLDNSSNVEESNPIDIPIESNKTEMIPTEPANICSRPYNSPKDEINWSESFSINKLIEKSDEPIKEQYSMNEKIWQCLHCQIYLSNENDMCSHVINKHKLETLIDKDNWVVIGGIKGLDYEEVKSQEDTNIKSLNNIHISTSSSRKRQFFESFSGFDDRFSNSNEWQNQSCHNYSSAFLNLESSNTHSDFESSINELRSREVYLPHFNGLLRRNPFDVEDLEGSSSITFNQMAYNTLNNDEITYNRKLQIFQNMLLQHQINSVFSVSLNTSFNNDDWHNRLRSNSIPDQLITENNQTNYQALTETVENEPILTPSKRTRLETGVKKCRKMYGIDQRHLWCNQCKWKKACSRFSSEINLQ